MTERPFKVRPFGVLKMARLDSAPIIVVTGNGLTPSKDLVRRFAMFLRLDAKMENPSLRKFPLPDEVFLADIERRRAELLGAALTIWRFGRLNAAKMEAGRPLGSYSTWTRWVVTRCSLSAVETQSSGLRNWRRPIRGARTRSRSSRHGTSITRICRYRHRTFTKR